MAEVPYDVFISYSKEDQDVANAIYDALKKENIKCWIAIRDIPLGDNFIKNIMQAIINCKIVIFVYSANSSESMYAQMEVHQAISNNKRVIPFKIGDVPNDSMFELLLSMYQRIEAMSPPYDQYMQRLVTETRSLLDKEAPPPVQEQKVSQAQQHPPIPADKVLVSDDVKEYRDESTGIKIERRPRLFRNIDNDIFNGLKMPVTSIIIILIIGAGSYFLLFNHGDTTPVPTIKFTQVPAPGSPDMLMGKVTNVNPGDNKVMVIIFVSGWWNKPSWDSPLTTINGDGTWECNINTDPNDVKTTKIAAFIVPANYAATKMMGQQTIPQELYQSSKANISVDV